MIREQWQSGSLTVILQLTALVIAPLDVAVLLIKTFSFNCTVGIALTKDRVIINKNRHNINFTFILF